MLAALLEVAAPNETDQLRQLEVIKGFALGATAPATGVRSVKAALSDVAPLLDRSHALLSLDTYLLVSKRRILVVSQDGAELRPTGGFMGSYGVIEVGPEGVKLEKYQDVYALPDPRRHVARSCAAAQSRR